MARMHIFSLAMALFACSASAEPPAGYSYSQPSPLLILGGGGGGGGHYEGGGFSGGLSLGGGGGHYEGGLSGGGGSYHSVPHGYQTSEGQHIDPHLLEEIKNILLKDEINNQQFQSSHSSGGGHGGISSLYGAPSPVYGAPHYQERVVGIELGRVKQGIQVAQYEQEGHGYASSGGGYPSGYASSGFSSIGGGGHGISSLGGGLSLGGGHGGGISSFGGGGLSLGGGHGGGISLGGGGHGGGGGISFGGSGHSGPGYTTIAIPAGSYGVPLPRYASPHH